METFGGLVFRRTDKYKHRLDWPSSAKPGVSLDTRQQGGKLFYRRFLMTKTMDAIYEDGLLRLAESVSLHERTWVRVHIELPDPLPAESPPARGPIAAMQRLIELTEGSRASDEDLQHFMDRVRERD